MPAAMPVQKQVSLSNGLGVQITESRATVGNAPVSAKPHPQTWPSLARRSECFKPAETDTIDGAGRPSK